MDAKWSESVEVKRSLKRNGEAMNEAAASIMESIFHALFFTAPLKGWRGARLYFHRVGALAKMV